MSIREVKGDVLYCYRTDPLRLGKVFIGIALIAVLLVGLCVWGRL